MKLKSNIFINDTKFNGRLIADPYLALVATAYGGVAGGSETQNQVYTNITGVAAGANEKWEQNNSTSLSYAHLNYILFDKNYGFKGAGFERVPSSANGHVTEISFDPVDITEPGYIYVFVSYSNESGGYVYFDDLQVTHHERLSVVQADDYYPFGMTMAGLEYRRGDIQDNDYLYNGKELQEELGLQWYDYGARMYDAALGRWNVVDPLAEKFKYISPYTFVENSPIFLIEIDGREPIKPFAGTINGFINFFNGLETGIGSSRGNQAHLAMIRMGSVNWNLKGPRPAATGPFNTSAGNRYIYTKKGGWIDMSHFMFYAGRGYQAKIDKLQAKDLIKGMREAGIPYSEIPQNIINTSMSDPVGQAVQDGFIQEKMDQYGPTYSAYSYEDLPSDKFGADFGVNYFDPSSDLTFSEQLKNYFNNVLEATDPESAPNYKNLPMEYPPQGELPSVQNRTTDPMFINK